MQQVSGRLGGNSRKGTIAGVLGFGFLFSIFLFLLISGSRRPFLKRKKGTFHSRALQS